MGDITGATRVYAILGDPVAQVGSPAAFNGLFAARGIDAAMVALQVPAAELARVFAGLREIRSLDGLVFTIPHKIAMAGLVDELGPNGRLVGAINAARHDADGRWVGDIFDGKGCVNALLASGRELGGRTVLQVGAGGVGRAIAFAFADAGIARLTVNDLDAARARDLARAVTAAFPEVTAETGPARVRGHDTVVNCTPLGMAPGDPPPVPAEDLAPGMLVVDVIVLDQPTPLLAAAEARGCLTQTGRQMLDGQVAEIARFFGLDA
jgi:shikimate dehydrogenase